MNKNFKAKRPEGLALVFSIPFMQGGLGPFQAVLSFAPVQPFANIAADYTCCDRNKKGNQ